MDEQNDDQLYVALELTNPVTQVAVQIQTTDYHMVGWTPRYLAADLVATMAETPTYSARVVRVSPEPAPTKQQVLIEMCSLRDRHVPMSGQDFQLVVT